MEDKENLEIENEEIEIEESLEEEVNNSADSEELERAKKLGYKDDAEYKGNPKYKLSPKEYLERAEKGGTIKKLESDITEMKSAFEKMQAFTKLQIDSANRTAREGALKELKEKQVKSVDDGTTTTSEAFDIYEREKVKVEKQYTPEPETTKAVDAPEIKQFYQENPWYDEDVVMQGAANALHRSIAAKHPTKSLGEQLKLVKQEIVERFPERFENPKRKIQSIEGGGSGRGLPSSQKPTFQSLGFSNSDIEDARKLIKSGTFKDEADFIKSYALLNKGRK